MLTGDKLKRLNELARKSKREPLTASEQEEQKQLREEYLSNFRDAFRKHLDSIEIVDDNPDPKRLQ